MPSNGAANEPVRFPQAILFGDSITQGAWATGGMGAELAHLYQRKMDIYNRGLSGYNTAWAIPIAKQLVAGTANNHVKLVTIWLGANDAALPPSPQAVELGQFADNMHSLVSIFRKGCPNASIVLIAPPPVDAGRRASDLGSRDPPRVSDRDEAHTTSYAEAVIQVGKQLNLHVVNAHKDISDKAAKDPDGLAKFLYDGLHLSAAGYAVVLEGLKAVISNSLPELHWDAMEQIFPHWADIPNEGALGSEFQVVTETPIARP